MQQILQQAKRAKPAACKAPHQRTKEHDHAGHIERQLIFWTPDHRLQGTDRTGSQRPWAGIAV